MDKDAAVSQSLDQTFAQNSTLHGLNKIVEAKKYAFKLAWIVIFSGCVGYLIYNVVELIEDYSRFSAVSEIRTEVRKQVLPVKKLKIAVSNILDNNSNIYRFIYHILTDVHINF